MRTIGNFLWHIPFLGFVSAFLSYVLGLFLTITIIAAPVGLGLMELGKFMLAPFGRQMIDRDEVDKDQNAVWKAYSTLVMILYFPFGLILVVLSLFQIVGLITSIFGIPVALVIFKSLGTYLNPVNKICVSSETVLELEKQKARDFIRKS